MKSSTEKYSLESMFVQILKGIFKVKSTNRLTSLKKENKGLSIKKNELDYFEYTYISD